MAISPTYIDELLMSTSMGIPDGYERPRKAGKSPWETVTISDILEKEEEPPRPDYARYNPADYALKSHELPREERRQKEPRTLYSSRLATDAVKDLERADLERKRALEDYRKLKQEEALILGNQLPLKQEVEKEQEEFKKESSSLDAERKSILDGLKSLKSRQESPGKALGKALAIGLGSFGAALSRSPNYALQILESESDRAARELASDRENAYRLLGLNEKEIGRIQDKYRNKQEFRLAIQTALKENQLDQLKQRMEGMTPSKELTNARLAAAKLENDISVQSERLRAQEGEKEKGKGVMPKGIMAIPEDTYRNLDANQKKSVSEADMVAREMSDRIEEISDLMEKDTNALTSEGKKNRNLIDRAYKSVAMTLQKAFELGVLNEHDIPFVMPEIRPYEHTTLDAQRRAMGELSYLGLMSMRKAENVAEMLGGSLDKRGRKLLQEYDAVFSE